MRIYVHDVNCIHNYQNLAGSGRDAPYSPMPKNKNMIKIKDNSVRFYDEDEYELTHPNDIKDWKKRNRQLTKEQSLKKEKK